MKTYIYPKTEIVRLASDIAMLGSLGASGDIHNTNPEEQSQSGNRAPKLF